MRDLTVAHDATAPPIARWYWFQSCVFVSPGTGAASRLGVPSVFRIVVGTTKLGACRVQYRRTLSLVSPG